MRIRQRAKLVTIKPEERYSPENIVTLGEVDLEKSPRHWTGWETHYPHTKLASTWGNAPIMVALGTYVGRVISWCDSTGYLWHSVIRWDDKAKKHYFVGNYSHGDMALKAMGVTVTHKWAPTGPKSFILKSIYSR